MGRYRYKQRTDYLCVTDQDARTLTDILDEFNRTGQLDSFGGATSYDFKDESEVDFNKPVPHDVDLYDAACGHDDPYLNVVPVSQSSATSDTTTAPDTGEGATTSTEA